MNSIAAMRPDTAIGGGSPGERHPDLAKETAT